MNVLIEFIFTDFKGRESKRAHAYPLVQELGSSSGFTRWMTGIQGYIPQPPRAHQQGSGLEAQSS